MLSALNGEYPGAAYHAACTASRASVAWCARHGRVCEGIAWHREVAVARSEGDQRGRRRRCGWHSLKDRTSITSEQRIGLKPSRIKSLSWILGPRTLDGCSSVKHPSPAPPSLSSFAQQQHLLWESAPACAGSHTKVIVTRAEIAAAAPPATAAAAFHRIFKEDGPWSPGSISTEGGILAVLSMSDAVCAVPAISSSHTLHTKVCGTHGGRPIQYVLLEPRQWRIRAWCEAIEWSGRQNSGGKPVSHHMSRI